MLLFLLLVFNYQRYCYSAPPQPPSFAIFAKFNQQRISQLHFVRSIRYGLIIYSTTFQSLFTSILFYVTSSFISPFSSQLLPRFSMKDFSFRNFTNCWILTPTTTSILYNLTFDFNDYTTINWLLKSLTVTLCMLDIKWTKNSQK